jgi:hypothetical protein
MSDETTTGISDVGVVGIPVAARDRPLDFYVGMLGGADDVRIPRPRRGTVSSSSRAYECVEVGRNTPFIVGS